jgi:ferric-dicitrate binding protein FerR (iron transport regulator)
MRRTNWPFSVRAGGATIHAAGTKFSVRLRDDNEADVLVIEGRIAIEGGKKGRGRERRALARGSPVCIDCVCR